MSLPLERIQSAFARALTDAAQIAAVAPALVVGDAGLRERFALYRGNLDVAWERALANAYPVVRALVGNEFFCQLARAYGADHPSTSGDLNRFGRQLADFLGVFEPARSLPYLVDVAALEGAVHRAHQAADTLVLTRERVSALAPGELLARRFPLHAACAWIESPFPIARIWLAHQPRSTQPLPTGPDVGDIALVTRPHWSVQVQRSTPGEIAALDRLRHGHDMEAAIAAGLGTDAAFDFPKALVRWIDQGILGA